MNHDDQRRDLVFQLWGWLLFILCALLFLASSLVNRDLIAAAASLVFLAACAVFMVPVLGAWKRRGAPADRK